MQPTGRPNPAGAASRSRSPSPDNQRGAVGGGQAAASLTGGSGPGLPPPGRVRPTQMTGQPPLSSGDPQQEPQGAVGGFDLPQLMQGLRVRDALGQSSTVAPSVGSRTRGETHDRPNATNATALRQMPPLKLGNFIYKAENLRFVMGNPQKPDRLMLYFQDRNGFTGSCRICTDGSKKPTFTKPNPQVSSFYFVPKPGYIGDIAKKYRKHQEYTGSLLRLDHFRQIADGFRAKYEPKEGYVACTIYLDEDDYVVESRQLGSEGYDMVVLGYDAVETYGEVAEVKWKEYVESKAKKQTATARPDPIPEEGSGSDSGSDDTAL